MAGRKTTIPYSELLAVARDAHRARPAAPLLTPGEFQKLLARSGRSCAWPTADAVLTALAVELTGDAGRLTEIGQPDLRRAVEDAWTSGSALQPPRPGGAPPELDERGWTPALARAMAAAQAAMRETLDRIGIASGSALREAQEEANERIKRAAEELTSQLEAVRAQLRDSELTADVAAQEAAAELRRVRESAAAEEQALQVRIAVFEKDAAGAAAELRAAQTALAVAQTAVADWRSRHDVVSEDLSRARALAESQHERVTASESDAASLRVEVRLVREELASVRVRLEATEEDRRVVSEVAVRHEQRIIQLQQQLDAARRESQRRSGARHRQKQQGDGTAP